MAYVVSIKFEAQDHISGPLRKIIDELDKAQVAVAEFAKKMTPLNRQFGTAGKLAAEVTQAVNKMGDAFAIGSVSADKFNRTIGNIHGNFRNVEGSAKRAREQIGFLKKAFEGVGGFAAGMLGGVAGYGSFLAANSLIGAGGAIGHGAVAMQHETNRLGLQSFTPKEQRLADDLAWRLSKLIPANSVQENLRYIMDARSIIRDQNLEKTAPIVEDLVKLKAVALASSDENVSKQADVWAASSAKISEALGHGNDIPLMHKDINDLAKVMQLYAGRVDPTKMANVLQVMRSAKYGMDSTEMMFLAGHMIQEQSRQGSGSRGIGPMFTAFKSMFVQGKMTAAAMDEWHDIGVLKDKYHGPLKAAPMAAFIRANMPQSELAIQMPRMFTNEVLIRALGKKFNIPIGKPGAKDEFDKFADYSLTQKGRVQLTGESAKLFAGTRQTGEDFVDKLVFELKTLQKQRAAFDETPGLDAQLVKANQDLGLKMLGVQNALANVGAALEKNKPLMGSIAKSLDLLTGGINGIANFLRTHDFEKMFPGITKEGKDVYDFLKDTAKDGLAGMLQGGRAGRDIGGKIPITPGLGAAIGAVLGAGVGGIGGTLFGPGEKVAGILGAMEGIPRTPVPDHGQLNRLRHYNSKTSPLLDVPMQIMDVPLKRSDAAGVQIHSEGSTIHVHGSPQNIMKQTKEVLDKQNQDILRKLQLHLASTTDGYGNLSSPYFNGYPSVGALQ